MCSWLLGRAEVAQSCCAMELETGSKRDLGASSGLFITALILLCLCMVWVQVIRVSPNEGFLEPGKSQACSVNFHGSQPPSIYNFNLQCSVRKREWG